MSESSGIDTDDAPPGIGHNRPPGDPPDHEAMTSRLERAYDPLLFRVDELFDALERLPVNLDDATHDRAVTFASQLATVRKKLDMARKTEGEPYLEAKRLIDGWFAAPLSRVMQAAAVVQERITAYLRARAEAERRAREQAAAAARAEAERLRQKADAETMERDLLGGKEHKAPIRTARSAEEAAQAAAEAERLAERAAISSTADLARTRTAHGTSTLRTDVVWSVENRSRACQALSAYLTPECIDKAIRAYVRANRDMVNAAIKQNEPLIGIRFDTQTTARTR